MDPAHWWSRQIKQISRPIFNNDTGEWSNRIRTLDPNGAGGYRVVDEEVHQSKDKKSLPAPWHANVDDYLHSKLPPILFAAIRQDSIGMLKGVKDYVDALGEVQEGYHKGGNPLSGTPFDRPYHSWPGTDKPWDWSTVHPYGRDPSPRPNPDGYAPRAPEPGRDGQLDNAQRSAAADVVGSDAAQPANNAPRIGSQTLSSLPPQVVATGNYLRANGIAITPRTVYMSHVIGPERTVDVIRRTGSTFSPDVPSADAATGDQVRAWVRALRGLPPAGAAGYAGTAQADETGVQPSMPDQTPAPAGAPGPLPVSDGAADASAAANVWPQ